MTGDAEQYPNNEPATPLAEQLGFQYRSLSLLTTDDGEEREES